MKYVIIFIAALCLFTSCGDTKDPAQENAPAVASEADTDNIKEIILSQMKEQENCWNTGNLECFMKHYWNSEELVFIGSSGPKYGWQTTLDNYKKSYPDKETMGKLTFNVLSVEQLSPKSAFVIGKWHLQRDSLKDAGGHYTLLWKKINGAWVIVADHSS